MPELQLDRAEQPRARRLGLQPLDGALAHAEPRCDLRAAVERARHVHRRAARRHLSRRPTRQARQRQRRGGRVGQLIERERGAVELGHAQEREVLCARHPRQERAHALGEVRAVGAHPERVGEAGRVAQRIGSWRRT